MIETFELTKKYKDLVALDRVSLSIEEGELFGLLGPNGAGKTTFVHLICGLLKPTSGAAVVGGFDIRKEEESIKKIIGFMPQELGLYDDLTVKEHLELYGRVYNIPDNERAKRAEELLEIIQLKDRKDSLVRTLSGGMKKKLSFICALIHQPKYLLLDEPTIGIDVDLRRDMWKNFKELCKRGTTVLITTHYLDEANYCDRLALFNEAKLIAVGSPEELKRFAIKEMPNPTLEDAFIYLTKKVKK